MSRENVTTLFPVPASDGVQGFLPRDDGHTPRAQPLALLLSLATRTILHRQNLAPNAAASESFAARCEREPVRDTLTPPVLDPERTRKFYWQCLFRGNFQRTL